MKAIIRELKSSPILWLSVFVPILVVMEFAHSDAHMFMFVLSILSIIPLAALLSKGTEGIAAKTGDTIGGLLNATLGNLTEMVIFIIALKDGLIDLVKASIAGAIVTNSLFMLGMSYLIGGLKYKVQEYNKPNAFIQSSMLFIVCIALLVPAIISKVASGNHPEILNKISSGMAILLMVIYLLGLLFSLKTHANFFRTESYESEEEEVAWPIKASLAVLVIAAVCISVVSEVFVSGIEDVAVRLGLSQKFVGFIIVPLVGAASEMMAAFSAARKNKLDISVSIAMGSSSQIALFITPLMVLLSYIIAPQFMNIEFGSGLIFMILFATLTISLISNQGKSTWYLGVLLLAVYSIFGITLFFIK